MSERENPVTPSTTRAIKGIVSAVVKGPSSIFAGGYNVLSSTSAGGDNGGLVFIAPGGLGSWKGGVKSTIIGANIAATTCGSNWGNFAIVMIGVDTTTDCASTTTYQAVGIGQGIKLATQSVQIGAGAGNGLTSGSVGRNTFLGHWTAHAATTMRTSTIIGDSVGSVTCGTNIGVILIGVDGTVDCPAANTNSYMSLGNAFRSYQQAPAISSGFGSGASVSVGTTSGAFRVNVGTGGAATSGILLLPAMANGYACSAVDVTSTDSFVTTAKSTSTSNITLNNYSRTTGLASAWTASDVIELSCNGY